MSFLFDLLTKKRSATDIRFRFVGLRTCVIQHFYVPKTDDLIIASNVIYIAKFFRVAPANQKLVMHNYLKDVAIESVTFQKDLGEDVYSHQEMWSRVCTTLTPFEQKAAGHVFSLSTGVPVYYTLGDADDGKYYGEYFFRLTINHGMPFDYMKISWGSSKLLLPMSVSVFFNHNLNQVSNLEARKRLLRVTLAFLEQMDSVKFSTTLSAKELAGFFKDHAVKI
jgi:hypothetical protein